MALSRGASNLNYFSLSLIHQKSHAIRFTSSPLEFRSGVTGSARRDKIHRASVQRGHGKQLQACTSLHHQQGTKEVNASSQATKVRNQKNRAPGHPHPPPPVHVPLLFSCLHLRLLFSKQRPHLDRDADDCSKLLSAPPGMMLSVSYCLLTIESCRSSASFENEHIFLFATIILQNQKVRHAVLLFFLKKNKILSLVTTTNIKTTGSLSEAGRTSDVI